MPSLPNHGAALHSCSCPSREDAESSADSSSSKAVADREYFFDFKLEDKPELEAVNAFATCLAGFAVGFAVACCLVSEFFFFGGRLQWFRCLTGMVDLSSEVFYELTRTSAGFQPGAASPMRVRPSRRLCVLCKQAKRLSRNYFYAPW